MSKVFLVQVINSKDIFEIGSPIYHIVINWTITELTDNGKQVHWTNKNGVLFTLEHTIYNSNLEKISSFKDYDWLTFSNRIFNSLGCVNTRQFANYNLSFKEIVENLNIYTISQKQDILNKSVFTETIPFRSFLIDTTLIKHVFSRIPQASSQLFFHNNRSMKKYLKENKLVSSYSSNIPEINNKINYIKQNNLTLLDALIYLGVDQDQIYKTAEKTVLLHTSETEIMLFLLVDNYSKICKQINAISNTKIRYCKSSWYDITLAQKQFNLVYK